MPSSHKRQTVIGVIGASSCDEDLARLASDVGRVIALRGAVLINGGGGGVMEASARGAKEAGGQTIGIIQGSEKGKANPYIDIVIVSALGQARNALIVQSADGLVAVGGSYGTLSEVAFSLKEEKPLAGLRSWNSVLKEIPSFESPEEAVDFVLQKIENNE